MKLLEEALRHHQAGRLNEAEQLYRQVLAVDSRQTDALHLLGVLAHQIGRNDVAVELIGRAVELNGRQAAYHSNLGLALKDLGRLGDVVAAYGTALRISPEVADVHFNLGIALHALGRVGDAVAAYRVAVCIKPDYAEAHSNLGNVLKDLRHLVGAGAAYKAALRIKPDHAEVHSNMGLAFKIAGRPNLALAACRVALCIRPDSVESRCNEGLALQDLGRLDEAVAAYCTALCVKNDFPEAHYNLGNALKHLGRLDEAVDAYGAALRLRPDYAEARSNLGLALNDLGLLDEAIVAYDAVLEANPDFAEARSNRGVTLLLAGRYEEAWADYEWRWQTKGFPSRRQDFRETQWKGECLAGRTILLHAEQGMGDAIQFCRYVPLVSARGGRVVLEVRRPLLRLLGGLAGVDQIIAAGDPLPVFDVHCPLMSLPQAFGTRLETIPARVPYLAAEPDRVASWRERLPSSGFRIGIVWQGDPTYMSDRDRSVPLACFAPLAWISGVRLISLQKGYGLDQLARLPDGMTVVSLGEDFDEGADAFLDSAAVMMSLDLIVTVDTAIGHLAGALGRPVWLPLATVPYWPWMMEREDSPWYPNTRLFRQKTRGDWQDVFERMALRLKTILAP